MPKPTQAQRFYMSGYAKGSVLDRASASERKRIREAMAKDRFDRAHYERGIHYGSEPRRTS